MTTWSPHPNIWMILYHKLLYQRSNIVWNSNPCDAIGLKKSPIFSSRTQAQYPPFTLSSCDKSDSRSVLQENLWGKYQCWGKINSAKNSEYCESKSIKTSSWWRKFDVTSLRSWKNINIPRYVVSITCFSFAS